MKILIIGDSHIKEDNLKELDKIFEEVCSYKADMLIHLGDYLHKSRATTKEFNFATKWAVKFKENYEEVVVLEGNHPSISNKLSSVDFLKYLGIKVKEDYELKDGDYKAYFAHFFTDKSVNFKTEKKKLSDLKGYNHIVLGHYHLLKWLNKKKNALHLGSIIFERFDEANQDKKVIGLIDTDEQSLELIELKYPIPMISTNKLKNLKDLDEQTKVRIVYDSWEKYKKHINKLEKYKNKFCQFKIKKDFVREIIETKTRKEKKSIAKFFKSYLKKLKNKDIKELLTQVLKKQEII